MLRLSVATACLTAPHFFGIDCRLLRSEAMMKDVQETHYALSDFRTASEERA